MSESSKVLGGMAISFDDWMFPDEAEHELTRLIGEIDSLQLRAVLWMLTAFSMGAVRRMGYAYAAGRQFALDADPDLARSIQGDNDAIRELVKTALADSKEVRTEDDLANVRAIALKEFEISGWWCPLIKPSYTAALTHLSGEPARTTLNANAAISARLRERSGRKPEAIDIRKRQTPEVEKTGE